MRRRVHFSTPPLQEAPKTPCGLVAGFPVVSTWRPDKVTCRRQARGAAAEAYDDPRMQARVCAAYASPNDLLPGDHVVLVDGSPDPAIVQARVWSAVIDAWGSA